MFSSCNKEEKTNDPFPPFIVLNGESVVWAELDKPYADHGAIAYDITSEQDTIDVSHRMIINNPVNTGQIGSYTVTYNVNDETGNKAQEKSRTVFVNIF